MIVDFGDKSLQTIACTGTNNQKDKENKTLHTPETQKRNRKTALAVKANYAQAWYAFYDLWPGNGVGPILQPKSPHGAIFEGKSWEYVVVPDAKMS